MNAVLGWGIVEVMKHDDTDELVCRMIGGLFDVFGALIGVLVAFVSLLWLFVPSARDDPYAFMVVVFGAGWAVLFLALGRAFAFLALRSARKSQ